MRREWSQVVSFAWRSRTNSDKVIIRLFRALGQTRTSKIAGKRAHRAELEQGILAPLF
jgi:hypothetical protein